MTGTLQLTRAAVGPGEIAGGWLARSVMPLKREIPERSKACFAGWMVARSARLYLELADLQRWPGHRRVVSVDTGCCPAVPLAPDTGQRGGVGPQVPEIPGAGDFAGVLCHSSDHISGRNFAGRKAVVVGSGTSDHDIAQDCYEQGVDVTLVQRGHLRDE
jgi:hypothetical protein